MGVVGAALRGFGKALQVGKRNKASADMFKKSKLHSKTTPDKSQLGLLASEAKIVTHKAKGATKLAKDVKENTELFKAGTAFKKGHGKFGFNKPSSKK